MPAHKEKRQTPQEFMDKKRQTELDLYFQKEMEKRICKNCKWWEESDWPDDTNYGLCKNDKVKGKCISSIDKDVIVTVHCFGCNQWEKHE